MEKHPLHLKIPELQQSEEVTDAVEKQERLTGDTLSNNPTQRIDAYMDRLENIFLNPDERIRERNLEMLRPAIYDAFIIKPEQVPESYFELQQQVARERGQPVENITSEMREQMIGVIIEDQRHSLDQWIDYLTSEDAVYPTYFKYFVFRNITKLSQFDKALGKFKSRTDTTTAPYPDVYREPLAKICDIYEKVAGSNQALKDPDIQTAFSKKFPKLYAEFITESLASKIENKEEIRGEWVKYSQNNSRDAEKLYKSLEGKGTGWCTAGQSTAEMQINSGDFYVYYTYDKNNEPVQPRIAIRMNGQNEIGEVRGILEHQSLEPLMQDVLEAKLQDFGPEADKYKKKSADMRQLTAIEKKTKAQEPLTKDELTFLYELNQPIEGFGYQKDPRIAEIRAQRNQAEDLPIIFDCAPDQIALSPENLSENTVAYIGPWNPTVLKQLPKTVKHIYEKFPEQKVFLKTIETDPSIKTPAGAEKALLAKGYKISDYAKQMLKKTFFSGEAHKYELVRFTVESLGFPKGATTTEIWAKGQELGLELCPAEVGPNLRLQYPDQPMDDYLWLAMEQITDAVGIPNVWDVGRDSDGSWLSSTWTYPGRRWRADFRIVFVSRKD